MGSTPSKTPVRSIKLPQSSAAALMPMAASEACARTDPHRRVAELEKQLSECESRCTDAEEQTKAAERQVSALQQELQNLARSQTTEEDHVRHTATLKAQEGLIRNLEAEITLTKQESAQMKTKYERKLQRLRTSSAKSQAESALAVFELKDENSKLLEENSRLLEKVHQIHTEKEILSHQASASSKNSVHNEEERERHCSSSGGSEAQLKLILELSQQVSALDGELRKAHKTIENLRKGSQQSGDCRRFASAASSTGYVSGGSSKHSLFEDRTEEI